MEKVSCVMFSLRNHRNIFLDFFVADQEKYYDILFIANRSCSATMVSFFDEQLKLRISRFTEAQFRR